MAKNIIVGLLTILLTVGLVYFIVCAACRAWSYVCVGVFGWPMLTKMQMFVLMILINLLSPVWYGGINKQK